MIEGQLKRGARRASYQLNSTLERFGLRLMWTSNVVIDLREVAQEPIEACYRSHGKSFLFDVPLERCRILSASAFSCARDSGNPFIDTLRLHAAGQSDRFTGSPLEAYYQSWQPRSAAEVLGLDESAGGPLACAPPLGFTFPWSALGIDESLAHWESIIEADNREHGLKSTASLGWKAWGPVDASVGEMEFRRLLAVYDSIAANGYKRNASWGGDVGGLALVNEASDFRVLVSAGHHRVAAVAALDYQTVPIRFVNALIRRSEISYWPGVRSGLFSRTQAEAVFDRIFEGCQPSGYSSAQSIGAVKHG